jgi:hypothetical protein
MAQVPKVKRGDAITAEWANALRDAIVGGRVNAGMMQGIMAEVLSLLAPERFSLGKIKGVNLSGTPVSGAYFPSGVTYQVKGIGKLGIDEPAMVPYYGREVRNDEARVYPARVNDTVMIERDVDDEGTAHARLMLFSGCEVVARKRCGTSGAGGGGGA